MGSCYSTAANWKKSAGSSKVEEEKEGEEGEVATTWSTGVANCSKKKKKQQQQQDEEKRRRKSKKKWDNEGWESDIPGNNGAGRMWMNGVNKSETACLYTQQGNKGINQDSMLVWENFSSRSDTIFCGVFDGHGPFGHIISKKVRDSLPLLLCAQWKSDPCDGKICVHEDVSTLGKMHAEETTSEGVDDEWQDSLDGQENGRLPEMCLSLKKAMFKAFKLMDKELKLHPTIDCFCSGTTAVTLIKQGQDLVIGNLGDSRAVLATRDKDNTLLAVQLTVDLKPDLPREAARIQQCKGRVFALQDEPEVARVWLPNSDSPGLAMARAFGDFCLKDFGLISVPEIYYYPLTGRDEFVILATDGVWDVLSNKEAVNIVAAAPGRATAARALVECAIRAWKLKYPTSKNDDCAVVCLFLKHSCASNGCMDNNHVPNIPQLAEEDTRTKTCAREPVMHDNSNAILLEHSSTWRSADEIVPVSMFTRERSSVKGNAQPKKTLAECISTTDDEEWSALEGIVRVNSLLSLPRFLLRDKR